MHIRCPHCQNPIEILEKDPSGDVSCPSCGSNFNLANDVSTEVGAVRMLGHYQFLDRLGQGGFGEVWKARDTELDRIVAIKIPRRKNLSERETEQFLREARAAAQVRHPNIVSVHEVGRADGSIYIATDFIEGAPLNEWMEAHPLTVRESVELCAKIAEALHYAHEAGVVHRDLKPQNILVDTSGEPHIADFGLAKRDAGEITMTIEGTILGTPAYMPPEQARGDAHHADRRSDVYSLGVILFRLLTGELPFRGQRQMLIVQILKEEPPALRKLDAKIPRDVETICLKCLEKDPARRYQSAAEFAADLRRWLTGHPIEARPVSKRERAWRWCHRNPTVASLGAAVVVVLLTGIATSSFYAMQSAARNRKLSDQTTQAVKNAKRADAKADEANANATKAQVEKDRADLKSEQARRNLYTARMNLASSNWENARIDTTMELLARYAAGTPDADLRAFEWHYWDRCVRSSLFDIPSFSRRVLSLTFSPDGKRLASAGEDNAVVVWDITNRHVIFTLNGHTRSVLSVAYSPDGKLLASASADQTVKLWNVTSGQETLTLKGHTDVVGSVTFSSDGKRLASGGEDNAVKVWNVANGQEMFTFNGHNDSVFEVAFQLDGKRLASASHDGTVKVWDLTTSREMLNWNTSSVFSVAFRPDGKQLASASVAAVDQTVKLWDVTTGQETLTLQGYTGTVTKLAFSPDGKQLASASVDETIKLWDTASGHATVTLQATAGESMGVAFSSDGKRIASVGLGTDGYNTGVVRVWDASNGQEMLRFKAHAGVANFVAFSPDGTQLASVGQDMSVKLWDITKDEEILTLNGHTGDVRSVAFSPDGKQLASAGFDRTVKLWNLTTGQETLTLKGHTGWVTSVAFSADGKLIASAGSDQSVRVWDATSGQEMLTLKGHTGAVTSVAFSPDGKQLTSACGDQTVKLWDATTGQEKLTLKGHTGSVNSVAFSADGKRIASASWDETVKLWDVTDGVELLTLKGHTDRVWSVAFAPDGRRLVSAGMGKAAIKMWDATRGQESLILKGHTGWVNSVAFSADGRRIASASSDQSVRVWDATSGQETLTLKGHTGEVTSVAFSPDGKQLASASFDRTVKLWDASNGRETLTLKGHTKRITCVTFSPDGKSLASSTDTTTDHPETRHDGVRDKASELKVWNATSGQETLTLQRQTFRVTNVAFSADGKHIASASSAQSVKVWDATSGQETLTLNVHTGAFTSVAFSPDGEWLATTSLDGNAKLSEVAVWEATSGQEVRKWKVPRSRFGLHVSFSPDGKRLVTVGDELVTVWDFTIGEETLSLSGQRSAAFSPDGEQLASASVGFVDNTVTVWDARPWTPELHVERESLGLVRFLFDRPLSKPEVLERIKSDETIRETVRQAALQIAERWQIVPVVINSAPKDQVTFDGIWVKSDEKMYWIARHNVPKSKFEFMLTENSKTLRPLCIAGYIETNRESFFGGVWTKNEGSLPHVARFDLTRADFQSEMQKYGTSFRLTSLDIYGTGQQQRYAALWTPSSDEIPWVMREELDQTTLFTENTRLKLEGYRPSVVTGYVAHDQTVKYVGVWVKDQVTADLELMSMGEFTKRIASPASDVFPIRLNAVGRDAQRTYVIIWSQSPPGAQWAISTSFGAADYQKDVEAQERRGFRLLLLNAD